MLSCVNPVGAWRLGTKFCKDGIKSARLTFSWNEAFAHFGGVLSLMDAAYIPLPCGHCAACQLRKRKDMSVRLTHEASMFENSTFLTLTYNEDSVPYVDGDDGRQYKTLSVADVQKFIKRLRRHLEYVPKKSDGRDHIDHVRYFAVGEYGSKTRRPHYHLIIFGWKPSDMRFAGRVNGRDVFRSAQVEKLWTMGYSSVQSVSPFVAKYCARYVTKKFARLNAATSPADMYCLPEFTLQSTRHGGIGATWFDKYGPADCLAGFTTYRIGDTVVKSALPRYYLQRLRKRNPELFCTVRDARLTFWRTHAISHDCIGDTLRALECQRVKDMAADARETF